MQVDDSPAELQVQPTSDLVITLEYNSIWDAVRPIDHSTEYCFEIRHSVYDVWYFGALGARHSNQSSGVCLKLFG